jgi:hypothetical protein
MGHTINGQKLLNETNNFEDLCLGGLITLKLILKRRIRNTLNLLLKKVLWRVVVTTIMNRWTALMTAKMCSIAG